jgi:hypothetical protein
MRGTSGINHRQNTFENFSSVGVFQLEISRTFRVWHHSKHIFCLVRNSRNIQHGAIRIGFLSGLPFCIAVTEKNLIILNNLFALIISGKKIALTMRKSEPCKPFRNQDFWSVGHFLKPVSEIHFLQMNFLDSLCNNAPGSNLASHKI